MPCAAAADASAQCDGAATGRAGRSPHRDQRGSFLFGCVAWRGRVTRHDVQGPEEQRALDAQGPAQRVVRLDRSHAYAGVLEAIDRIGIEARQVGGDEGGGGQIGLGDCEEIGDVDATAYQAKLRGALDLADRRRLPRCASRRQDDIHQDTLTRVT